MPIPNRVCFQVNLRDGLRCRGCGALPASRESYHRGFEYHHVQQRADGGADTPGNLILLCHVCHLAHHRETALDFKVPPMPRAFDCAACGRVLDPETVDMNCGWYRCGNCGQRTHLFDHCRIMTADSTPPRC